jgi:hypothetical protein
MIRTSYSSFFGILLADAGRHDSDCSQAYYPFGAPGVPLDRFCPEEFKDSKKGNGFQKSLRWEEWGKVPLVIIDGAPKGSPDLDRPIIESLRGRGFGGKIERESAYLFRAIESIGEDTVLIDAFNPRIFYGSSSIDRSLRELIASKTILCSVTSFENGNGKDDSMHRVIVVLKKGDPVADHTVRFRRLNAAGEILTERDVPIGEIQNACVWVPDRFFVQKEKYLDEGIKTVQLGSVCLDIFRGAPGRFFSTQGEDEIRYLSLRHVGAGLLNVNSLAVMRIESVQRIKRYLLKEGDVIVSCRGEFFRPLLLTGESSIPVTGGDNYVIIRPDLRLVDPGFLFRYLRSRAGQAFLLGMSTGKKIRVLNVRAMYEIPVPLPDLTTQKAVGDNFTRAEQRLESERKRVESEYRDGADALFQKMGLLPASIDGENRFSD